jgi:hypothetical protein
MIDDQYIEGETAGLTPNGALRLRADDGGLRTWSLVKSRRSGPNELNRRKTDAPLSEKNTSRTSFRNVLAPRNSAIASDETPAASSIGYP